MSDAICSPSVSERALNLGWATSYLLIYMKVYVDDLICVYVGKILDIVSIVL